MFAAVNIFDLLKKTTSLGNDLTGQTELGFSRIPPFLMGVRRILPTVINVHPQKEHIAKQLSSVRREVHEGVDLKSTLFSG